MPFIEATKKIKTDTIKPPDFELEDVEDYYAYYVHILGISEEMFWFSDISFVLGVVENITAYDGWYNYVIEKERKKSQ